MWIHIQLGPSHLDSNRPAASSRLLREITILTDVDLIEIIPGYEGSVVDTLPSSDHLWCSGNISGQQLVCDAESIAHGPNHCDDDQAIWSLLPLKSLVVGGTVFQIKSTSKEQANRSFNLVRSIFSFFTWDGVLVLLNKFIRAFILYFWYGAWNMNALSCPNALI